MVQESMRRYLEYSDMGPYHTMINVLEHQVEGVRRQLAAVGIDVHDVFLLHEAFYDAQGRALLPTAEPD